MSLQRISTIAYTPTLLPEDAACVEPDCFCQASALVASPSGLVWPVCQEAADYATWSTSGMLELPDVPVASWADVLASYRQAVRDGLLS